MADGSSITNGMFNSFVSHLTLSSDFIPIIIVIMFVNMFLDNVFSSLRITGYPKSIEPYFFCCCLRHPLSSHGSHSAVTFVIKLLLLLLCPTFCSPFYSAIGYALRTSPIPPSISLHRVHHCHSTAHWTRYTIKYNSNEWRISFPIISRLLNEMSTDSYVFRCKLFPPAHMYWHRDEKANRFPLEWYKKLDTDIHERNGAIVNCTCDGRQPLNTAYVMPLLNAIHVTRWMYLHVWWGAINSVTFLRHICDSRHTSDTENRYKFICRESRHQVYVQHSVCTNNKHSAVEDNKKPKSKQKWWRATPFYDTAVIDANVYFSPPNDIA